MRYPAILMVQRRSITERRIASGGKAAHGGGGGVCWGVLKRGARHFVRHAHDLGGWGIAGRSSSGGGRSRVTGRSRTRDQRGRGHGDTGGGIGHRQRRRTVVDILLLDGVQRSVDGGIGVGRRVRSSPGIGELRGIGMREAMMVVDRIKGHSAVWAVLVLKDHRHSSKGVWKCMLGTQRD